MAKSDLREWAVKGAEQRLVELADEARAIFAAFPELRGQGRGFEVSRGRKAEPATSYARQAPSQEDVSRCSTEDCCSLRRNGGRNGGRRKGRDPAKPDIVRMRKADRQGTDRCQTDRQSHSQLRTIGTRGLHRDSMWRSA